MKRVLLITFVLMFALASSAMAEISLGGHLGVEVSQSDEQLKIGEGAFGITTDYGLTVSASSEEAPNWTLSANLGKNEFELGSYHLNLQDQLFTLDFWGNEKNVGDKADVMGFVTAAGATDAGVSKLRVSSDIAGPVDLTLDYAPAAELVAFGEFAYDEYDLGVAVHRAYPNTDSVVGYGEFDFDAVVLKAAAGTTLGVGTSGLAYGADLSVPVTDQVTVSGRFEARDVDFNPNDNGKLLRAGVDYAEAEIEAGASYQTEGTFAVFNKNTLSANMSYAFDEDMTLSVDGSNVVNNSDNAGTRHTTMSANATFSAPLIEDTVSGSVTAGLISNDKGVHCVDNHQTVARATTDGEWAIDQADGVVKWTAPTVTSQETIRAFAGTVVSLDGNLTIEASEKLTLGPSLSFKTFSGGNEVNFKNIVNPEVDGDDNAVVVDFNNSGSRVTLKSTAAYKIGTGDTVLSADVGQHTYSYRDNNQFATFKVKVTF